MGIFKYVARNPATGEKINSEVKADNKKNAAAAIQKLGYVPIEIYLPNEKGSSLFSFLDRVKSKEKVLFTRQLSTLINAGLPIVQSLSSVQSQTGSKKLQGVVSQIIVDVESGMTLSKSMEKHPDVFNEVYISLISAGEASGTLDRSLERLANQQEKDAEIISKTKGAMIYPLVILVVTIFVVVAIMIIVMPKVEEMYKNLPGAKLPFVTRALISVSTIMIKFWWAFIALLGMGLFGVRKYFKSSNGKKIIDTAFLSVPPFNKLFKKIYMARFTRTANTLVGSGVPILQVLEISGKSVNNSIIKKSLQNAAEKVRTGRGLAESLESDKYIIDIVPKMIKIGEQSGSLEAMLGRSADYFEKEVDSQIKAISTLIEPVMMVMLGGVVMIIVVAVLLPIYSIAGQSGFGV